MGRRSARSADEHARETVQNGLDQNEDDAQGDVVNGDEDEGQEEEEGQQDDVGLSAADVAAQKRAERTAALRARSRRPIGNGSSFGRSRGEAQANDALSGSYGGRGAPAAPADGQDESTGDQDKAKLRNMFMNKVPESDIIRGKLRVRVKRPTKNNSFVWAAVADFQLKGGDDWRERVRAELGKDYGPGEYVGVFYTNGGEALNEDEPIALEITEEMATGFGWEGKKKANSDDGTSSPPVVIRQEKELDIDTEARNEQGRINLLKFKLETTKLEQELKALTHKPESTDKKKEESMSEDVLKRVVDAEKASMEAQHKAKLAEIEAKRTAEAERTKSDHERALDRVRADADAEKRRIEGEVKDLKGAIDKKDEEHKRQISDLTRNMDTKFDAREAAFTAKMNELAAKLNTPPPAPPPVPVPVAPPERRPEEIAQAFANVLGPFFKPLVDIAVAKITAPAPVAPTPPPPPDPTKQIEALAKAMEAMRPPTPPPPKEPKQVDPMEITRQTISMIKDMMPAPAAPVQQLSAADIAAAVRAAMPDRDDDDDDRPEPVDPMQQTTALFDMAARMAEVMGGKSNTPVVEEREPPQDPIDVLIENKKKMEALGFRVQNGDGAPALEPAKTSPIKDVFEGLKETLPHFGTAMGQYMKARGPQYDEALIKRVQLEELRQRQGVKKKRTGPPAVQQGGQQQPAAGQQQRPAAGQPQPRPQAPRPAQPRPAAPQQPRPQAPPQQAPRPAAGPAPQQPQQPRPTAPAQQAPRPVNHQAANGQVAPQAQRPAQPAQRQAAPQKNKFVPEPTRTEDSAYGIPTTVVPKPRPVFQSHTPTEDVPFRGKAPPGKKPVDHIPQRAPSAPVSNDPPEEFREILDAEGRPTQKTWGELATYATKAIQSNVDPEVAAIHLLERFPIAAGMVQIAATAGIDALDAALSGLAAEAGPYATAVGELGSSIRSEPGASWAKKLTAVLNGSTAVAEPVAAAAQA